MRVNHGSADVLVTQKFLYRTDIIAVRQQVGGKAVPQCMTADGLDNCAQFYGLLNRLLNAADMQVMSSFPYGWNIPSVECTAWPCPKVLAADSP